jgi:hypothetical protein
MRRPQYKSRATLACASSTGRSRRKQDDVGVRFVGHVIPRVASGRMRALPPGPDALAHQHRVLRQEQRGANRSVRKARTLHERGSGSLLGLRKRLPQRAERAARQMQTATIARRSRSSSERAGRRTTQRAPASVARARPRGRDAAAERKARPCPAPSWETARTWTSNRTEALTAASGNGRARTPRDRTGQGRVGGRPKPFDRPTPRTVHGSPRAREPSGAVPRSRSRATGAGRLPAFTPAILRNLSPEQTKAGLGVGLGHLLARRLLSLGAR